MRKHTAFKGFCNQVTAATETCLKSSNSQLRCVMEPETKKLAFFNSKDSMPYPIGLRLDKLWQVYQDYGMDSVRGYLKKTIEQIAFLDAIRTGLASPLFVSCLINEDYAIEQKLVSWPFLPGLRETFFLDLNRELLRPTKSFLDWLGFEDKEEAHIIARRNLEGMLPYLTLLGDEREAASYLELAVLRNQSYSKLVPMSCPATVAASFLLLPEFQETLLANLYKPEGIVWVGVPISSLFIVMTAGNDSFKEVVKTYLEKMSQNPANYPGVWDLTPNMYELFVCPKGVPTIKAAV